MFYTELLQSPSCLCASCPLCESSTLWWLRSCCERHLSLPSQAGPLSSQQLLLKLTSAHMEQLVLPLEQSLPVLCGENFLVGVL